jgi:hypothetical protein
MSWKWHQGRPFLPWRRRWQSWSWDDALYGLGCLSPTPAASSSWGWMSYASTMCPLTWGVTWFYWARSVIMAPRGITTFFLLYKEQHRGDAITLWESHNSALEGPLESADSLMGPGSKASCCTGVCRLRKSFQPSKEYQFQWLQWLTATRGGRTLLEIHPLVGHGGWWAKHITLRREAGWQWYRASSAQGTGWTTSKMDTTNCSTTLTTATSMTSWCLSWEQS